MPVHLRARLHETWQTLSSIKTGVVLIILVVIFSVAGTIILQRPMTDPEEMQRAYSPVMLRFLDATGLTDVFHARWFVALLTLVCFSIIAASVERFPNAWRYFARPYKSPDETFRRALPTQAQIAISNEEEGLAAAERAFRHFGLKPERIVRTNSCSLFAERYRISEMGVYIVHASLLLLFFGWIIDGTYGWRGALTLNEGQTSNQVELRDGTNRTLPFAIRCDAAGQENYQDGTPKKWWSSLAVVDRGQDVTTKEIVVNDPLIYNGVRFYQASFGETGKVDRLFFDATPNLAFNAASAGGTYTSPNPGEKKEFALTVGETADLDADTTVRFAEFFSDYAVREGQVYKRSNEIGQPAVHLVVTRKSSGQNFDAWFPQLDEVADNSKAPYVFQPRALKWEHFTGLQVSHEPGQWGVWSGVVLLVVGLTFVFYVVHARFWVVPVRDERSGQLSLWIGGNANRNRDAFEQRFNELVAAVEKEVKPITSSAPTERIATATTR
jgi:cytochrome c biogenesis protein